MSDRGAGNSDGRQAHEREAEMPLIDVQGEVKFHHDATVLSSRNGVWVICGCDWKSPIYGGREGAQYAWACHVSDAAKANRSEAHGALR